jgi:DGQHR domain-containing protein
MRLDAFKITPFGFQGEVELYSSVFQTKELVKRFRVDRWTLKNTGGYQRLITESRLKDRRGSILRFLVKEMGCFPTSVLVNIHGEVSFEEERDYGWCKLGKLDTFDEPFWLIDGQHRVEALKEAINRKIDYEDYPFIVSILKLQNDLRKCYSSIM